MSPSGPVSSPRLATPAIDCGSPQLDAAEVHALTWPLAGGARRTASWSLCARHTWGLALAESALGDETLPVARGLIAAQLRRNPKNAVSRLPFDSTARRLHRHNCPVCLHAARRNPEAVSTEQRELVNHRTRFEARLQASRAEWELDTCPVCLGGKGLPCRPHVLSGTPVPTWLPDALRVLATRVAEDAAGAWVQGLGWLAGWGLRDRAADVLVLSYFGHPTAAVESPRERLRRIVREALRLQDEAAELIAAIGRDEPPRELALRVRAGPMISRFEALRRDLPARNDTAMGRLAVVLDSVLEHHAMRVSAGLVTSTVTRRSRAMRGDVPPLEGMGHMGELLEDVADLLAVRRS